MHLCQICNSETSSWGITDFNQSAGFDRKQRFSKMGIDVEYVKCNSCGFIYSPFFNEWSHDDFKKCIYNDDYIKADPDYVNRGAMLANWFCHHAYSKEIAILDFGAGPGTFGKLLNERGYNVTSWDPFWHAEPTWGDKKFDLITSFEVFEHTSTPIKTIQEMHQWMAPTGELLFSTLVNDVMQGQKDIGHWYIAPRNGHICMHSFQSLKVLCEKIGMKVKHTGTNVHQAYYNSSIDIIGF